MLEQYSEILTVDDVCEILKIGKNAAYHLLNKRDLKAFRIGRSWKVSRSSIENYINNATNNHTTNL